MSGKIHPLTGEPKGKSGERPELFEMHSRARPARSEAEVRATYDAASNRDRTYADYWQHADALDADSSNSRPVRAMLVKRSRYEVANNGYADGAVQTYSNYLVGKGPRPRIQTGDKAFDELAEKEWDRWAKAIQLRRKLWCMTHAKIQDGEPFGLLRQNPKVDHPVKLDLVLIETEQCQSPFLPFIEPGRIDGVKFDEFGNPTDYEFLPYHPGGLWSFGIPLWTNLYPANHVLHWFQLRRAGQHRGIPEFKSTLNTGASSRRFREATVSAAETAADLAAIISTNSPPDEIDLVQPMSTFEIVKRMMMVMPAGYGATQMKAEHPNASYPEFLRQQINETGRPKSMPYNVTACDSSNHSYASGRLDFQPWYEAMAIDRLDCDDLVLSKLFALWWKWAVLSLGWDANPYAPPDVLWDWPKFPAADLASENSAKDMRLRNGTAYPSQIYAEEGRDFEEELPIMARDYGCSVDEMRQILRHTLFNSTNALGSMSMADTMKSRIPPGTKPTPKKPVEGSKGVESFPAISAAAAEDKSSIIAMQADVTIEAAGEGEAAKKGPRKFDVTAYTGDALTLPNYEHPVVVDLQGLSTAKSVIANLDHVKTARVGHVTGKENDGKQLRLSGLASAKTAARDEVIGSADDGFQWQASIEAAPKKMVMLAAGKTATVNGREFTGPHYIARKSVLTGFGFVSHGASENTSVSIAASADDEGNAMNPELLAFITAAGFTEDEYAALTAKQQAGLKAKHAEIVAAATKPTKTGSGKPATPEPEIEATAEFDLDEIKASSSELVATIEASLADHEDNIRDRKKYAEIKATALKEAKALKAKALKERWSTPKFEVESIKAASAVELALVKAEAPIGPAIHASAKDLSNEVIEAAFCQSLKMPGLDKQFTDQVLQAAHTQFRGRIGLQQSLIMAAAMNGLLMQPGERIHQGNIRTVLKHATIEGASVLSLPTTFANIANKELLLGYMEEDQTWREIAVVKPVNDFKSATSFRLLDNMEYELIPQDGKIAHGQVSEEKYTRQANTYAKMFQLTRVDIINDDQGAFNDLRTRLGRGSSRKFNNLFWQTFMANIMTLFTSARGNYISGSTTNLGVDGVGLELGLTAFRTLKTPEGKRMEGSPVKVVVPPELAFNSDRLYQSTNVNTGGSSTATSVPNENIHSAKYRPVVQNRLSDSTFSGYSTTGWGVFRDVSYLAPMVVSFLNGVETPTVESAQADFDTLGIDFRGYHDFGTDIAEYLSGVWSKGTS